MMTIPCYAFLPSHDRLKRAVGQSQFNNSVKMKQTNKRKQKQSVSSKALVRQRSFNSAEILLVHRPASTLSKWWRFSQLISFAVCAVGGFFTSITMGRIRNGFSEQCVLFSELRFRRFANLSDIRTLDIHVERWGPSSDCDVCEFGPMAGACVAFMLGALFLQCSNVGELQSRINISWMIVIPAIPITLTLFIFSCVILAYTAGGLSHFCAYMIKNTNETLNLTSCSQIYSLTYPYQPLYFAVEQNGSNDMYIDFVLLPFGASLHFLGWSLSLGILLLRCFCFADFQAGRHVAVRRPVFDDLSEKVYSYPITTIYEESSGSSSDDGEGSSSDYQTSRSSFEESLA